MFLTIGVLAAACTYDESELSGQLDDINDRIEKLKGDVEVLNTQLGSLNEIAKGNPITKVTKDSDGKYVITYLNDQNEEKTIVLATMDQMVKVPMLGVKQDSKTSPFYWTIDDEWLYKDGERVPVSGFAPDVTVDAEGYWTIDGERIKDFNGNDLYAHDGESCLFKSIDTDEDGDLVITQGNGNVITIPVQGAVNLTLSVGINTPVLSTANPVSITYDVTGVNSKDAMVAIADAQGLGATIDRETKTITVTFASSFTSGYLVVIASDLEDHMVIRPVFFSTGSGEGGGGSDEPLDYYPIYNAQDLVAFASGVNAGTGMETMDAKLMTEINMSGVTSWTPIGHCVTPWSLDNTETYWNKVVITSGTPYKGHFDGQGFTIKGFKMVCSNSVADKPYGMFGTLAEGAIVENIVFDSSCSITSSPTVRTDCGLVAGLVWSSTVRNITNNGEITYNGNASAPDNVRQTLAMIGLAYADNNNVTIENLKNTGAIVSKNSGHNTKNGATGVQVAGILGLGTNGVNGSSEASAGDMAGYVNVVNCTNDGPMTSDAPRTSGIVAACNRFTFVDGCTNNASQTNSHAVSKNGRLGNITCITGSGSKLRNCTNNGDLVSSTSARCGGVVGFVNHKSNTFENCHNTGNVISDWDAGLFFGYDNVVATFTNCSVSGSTGTYNGGTFKMNNVTSSNYISSKYVGNIGANATDYVTTSTIRYVGENAVGIKSAADLVEFASLVNSGQSYAKYQAEDGVVYLLKDIDMSSVTSWTPIGYATVPAGDGEDKAITGNAFAGKFDGNAFKIKNLKMKSAGSTAGQNYGLFGTLAPGAVVQHFTIDESCSLEVTATARIATGVVAGFVYDATVRDVTSYAPMTFNGKVANDFMSMAMIGQVYANTKGTIVDSCHNYGEIVANNTTNTQSGATAYHAAGIVGFAHAVKDCEKVNTISSCSNNAKMTSALSRTSGICCAANRSTEIFNCDNHGDQTNSFVTVGGARLGNIACVVTNSCVVSGCTNYGDLISTTKGRIGGITSLPNKATFTNCANYGEILTDQANGYRGVFFGFNGNGNGSTWKNCTAGGKVGTYNNGSPVYDSYTDAEKESYLGKFGDTAQTYENITYLIGTTEPVVGGSADYNILFIGNSFTMDAVTHLPGLLDGANNKRVRLTLMYFGGRTIEEYYSGWDSKTDYHHYEAAAGSKAFSEISKTSAAAYNSLPEAVGACEWDVITFQEHTGRTAAWSWTSTAQTQIQGLINYAKAAYPSSSTKTPKFYYIMSQAYKDMTLAQGDPTWSQIEMYNAIVAYGKKVMETCTFDGIIATGTMLQNLRTSSANTSMDSTRDGYHMDNGLARYGAAATVFETLITPVFGTTMDGNSFRYNVSNTSTSQYSTPVTSANAPIAIQAARYAVQKPFEITNMGTPSEPEVGTDEGGIDTAAEFLAFLQAVNAGTSLSEYMNASGEVLLKANIDLSSITNAQWQAIADGTSVENNTYTNSIAAGAFKGTFNGNSKKITGFNPTVALASGKTFGLLPVLQGATVKNLEISGAMKLSASAVADAGMLCGTALNSTISNVKVSGTINSTGISVDQKRFSIGGICGYAVASGSSTCTIESCTSDVVVTAVGGTNLSNGASAAMYGGIVGYATAPNDAASAASVLVKSCTNNGDMTVTLGRAGGIVGTAIRHTTLNGCTNNGDQVNAIANGRLGNVCGVMQDWSSAVNCKNYGTIEATQTDYPGNVGGLFGLAGSATGATVTIQGGGNYGTVKVSPSSTNVNYGLLGGYINTIAECSNVVVSGKLYVNGSQVSVSASNYMDYIGRTNASHASKITGLTYVAPTN